MAEEEYTEVNEMDLIYESHDRIDALLELLIKKKIITQEEYDNKVDALFEEAEKEAQKNN